MTLAKAEPPSRPNRALSNPKFLNESRNEDRDSEREMNAPEVIRQKEVQFDRLSSTVISATAKSEVSNPLRLGSPKLLSYCVDPVSMLRLSSVHPLMFGL